MDLEEDPSSRRRTWLVAGRPSSVHHHNQVSDWTSVLARLPVLLHKLGTYYKEREKDGCVWCQKLAWI